MAHRATIAVLLTAAALPAGCVVGPNYEKPRIDSPATFRIQTAPEAESIANTPWWEVYKDPTLQELIRTALKNNYDVRIAASRVEQARAVAAQALSYLYPSVGYQAGLSTGRNEFLGAASPNGGDNNSPALGALSAAWEIDLWGRIRRQNEQALAVLLATEEAKRGVILTLVADTAQAYFELLELDAQLEISVRTTASFQESLNLFTFRLQGGAASKLETSRAEAALASTAATIPEIERQIILKENQINVLLGRPPAPVVRTAKLLDQIMPPDVPAGIPSELLERRPDILTAEAGVRAANAQVGVAQAQFFPRFGLTALFGKVSPDVSDLLKGSSNMWSLAGSLTGPIFTAGNLDAQLQQAKAIWEESRLRYELTALNALQEVSNSLATREKLVDIRANQARAVSAYQESVKVANQRYVAGKSAYFEVLEAQQQLFPAETALARTQLNQLLAVVQLYKALGGGWRESDQEAPGEGAAPEAPSSASPEPSAPATQK